MKLAQNAGPAAEPVDLDDAKAHLRVDSDHDDDLIVSMIAAARLRAEQFCQKSFVTQSWYLYLDHHHRHRFVPPLLHDRDPNRDKINLPMGPVISVDSFSYLSAPNIWSAVDPSWYYADIPGNRLILTPRTATVPFPCPIQDESGLRIGFTAGFGAMPDIVDAANPNPVPPTIRLAIKTILLHMYENRESHAAGKLEDVPLAGESLLLPHRAMNY